MSANCTRLGVRAQLLPKPVELRRRDDDERGLAGRHALADERADALDELVVARVEQSLVPERARVLVGVSRRVHRPSRVARFPHLPTPEPEPPESVRRRRSA
jgi:hypothetical protein